MSGPATPALVQHVSPAYLAFGGAGAGDDFVRTLTNPVSQDNCIVLGVSYPHGVTPTISDNNGNTWGAAAKTIDTGTLTDGSQAATSIFVLPKANAGLTQFKMHFGASVFVIDYFIAEFCNVATASPVDITGGAGNQTAPNLACGSVTPGNSGDLIIAYFAPFATIAGHVTGWTPGGSFNLIHGDFSSTNGTQRPHCAMYFVQPSAGAINPGVTASGSTDSFNCVAVALKSASAGSPRPTSGKIWIPGVFTHTEFSAPASPMVLKCPVLGTDRVLFVGLTNTVTGITDSAGGTWTKVTSGAIIGELWYSTNNSPNPNLVISVANASGFTYRLFDVDNVDHTSAPVTAIATGDASGVSAISNAPSIIPGVSNGVAITECPLGQGPVFALTSPVGGVPDMGLYTGETDTDTLENADGVGHLSFTSNPGTINFNWTIVNVASNNFGAVAISFKAA